MSNRNLDERLQDVGKAAQFGAIVSVSGYEARGVQLNVDAGRGAGRAGEHPAGPRLSFTQRQPPASAAHFGRTPPSVTRCPISASGTRK